MCVVRSRQMDMMSEAREFRRYCNDVWRVVVPEWLFGVIELEL